MRKKISNVFMSIVYCVFCAIGLVGCASDVLTFESDFGYIDGDYTQYYTVTGCKDNVYSVTIPKEIFNKPVAKIADNAFEATDGLKNVSIPNTVLSIGAQAFSNCGDLVKVTMDDNVKRLGSGAFYECKKLENVTLSKGLTAISSKTFYGCSSLSSVELPMSVSSIGEYAFYGCSELRKIEIPASVTKIEQAAFFACENLWEITFNGTVEEWNAIEKVENWKTSVPATDVFCDDGNVAL